MKLRLSITGDKLILTGSVLRTIQELLTLAEESGKDGINSFEFELDELFEDNPPIKSPSPQSPSSLVMDDYSYNIWRRDTMRKELESEIKERVEKLAALEAQLESALGGQSENKENS